MRKMLGMFGLILLLASCSHTRHTRSGFTLKPGETHRLSFKGEPVSKVRIDLDSGRIEVVFRYRDESGIQEVRSSGKASLTKKNAIEEVVITAQEEAAGSVEVE